MLPASLLHVLCDRDTECAVRAPAPLNPGRQFATPQPQAEVKDTRESKAGGKKRTARSPVFDRRARPPVRHQLAIVVVVGFSRSTRLPAHF